MSLYEGAVKKPIMTSLCFLAVVIFGLFSLSKLPIDLYPDIDTNTIMVMTAYPGASASDIENNVTRPLENTLNAVSNLKHITSRSSENMSLITLEFEFGNDIDVLTNDVRDKLDMVSSQLPDDVENPIIFKFSPDNGTDRFDTQVVCFQFIGVTVYLDLTLRCTTDRYCTHTGNTCQGIHHAVVQNFIKCRLALFRLDGKQYDRNHIRTELEDNR